MKRLKPVIAEQNSSDIQKMTDLIEVAGSRPDLAVWRIDGVEYRYRRGDTCISVGGKTEFRHVEFNHLDKPDKTAAKRKIFELAKGGFY